MSVCYKYVRAVLMRASQSIGIRISVNVIHIKISFCVLVLVILTSCSMPRFLYDNADMVLLYWFDDHFNLRNEQRLDLKKK